MFNSSSIVALAGNGKGFAMAVFIRKELSKPLLQNQCACCTTSFQRYGKKISEIENVVINVFKILIFSCINGLFSVN